MNPRIPLFAAALALLVAPAAAQDIVALCIGNDAYARAEDRLETPVADATLMAETLRAIPGVRADDVVLLKDGTREAMERSLRQFREKARGAKLAIVFYSGHGMEDRPTGFDRAETFLLPVDAEIGNADDLPARAVGLGDIMATFRGLPPAGRVVILDCCRTGAPSATKALAGAGKNVSEDLDARVARALGEAELAEGTLVSFSAGPGRKAAAFLQDTDAYSPFTHFLAKGIREQGGDLFGIVSLATATTREATGGRQVPRVKFEGDPSLIAAVRFGASAEAAEQVEETGSKMSEAEIERRAKEMADRLVAEALGNQGGEGTMVKTDVVTGGGFSADRGMEGTRAGEVRSFGGIEMVWCPPGEFLMGSPAGEKGHQDDETQHRVRLTRGFWLAKTETTQGQWERVMGSNPSSFKGEDLPVETVSWDDVQGWLTKMNERHPLPSGWKWELPTEAQWEYACRAGTTTVFSFGGVLNGKEANCYGTYPNRTSAKGPYLGKTMRVGSYAANAWGLHDMHGNVWEWCRDWYGDYPGGSATDPSGVTTGSNRVNRGGSWNYLAADCRSAYRNRITPGTRYNNLGFRPAAVPASR